MIMTSCALCVEEGEVGRREKGRFARARLGHLHAGHAHRRHVRKCLFAVSHPSIDCRDKQGIAWGSFPSLWLRYSVHMLSSALPHGRLKCNLVALTGIERKTVRTPKFAEKNGEEIQEYPFNQRLIVTWEGGALRLVNGAHSDLFRSPLSTVF